MAPSRHEGCTQRTGPPGDPPPPRPLRHRQGSTWWNAEADGATYTFRAEGGTVTRLASGAVCGE